METSGPADHEQHPCMRFRAGSEIRSSPAIAQGCLVFGSGDGSVFCLEPIGGAHRG